MSTPTLFRGGSPSDAAPMPPTVPSAHGRVRAAPTNPAGSVLVIEPSGVERERIRAVLSAGGLEVHACADLRAAEELVTRLQPGLILARWDLPSGGGLDLLRSDGPAHAGPWTPVILHGGGESAEGRIAALELGALDVLATMPADDELLARLRSALRLRRRMAHLERRAYRDALTGLINRGALEDQLSHHWAASRRHGTGLSVLMADLDRFKEFNDTHGHPAGDEALRRVADVLSRSVRGSDVVARYGGDEFVIVAPACAPAHAVSIAGRLRAELAVEPGLATAPGVVLTLSVGISGTDGQIPVDLDDLLRRADRALYLAKRSGRDAAALYDPARDGPKLVD